MAAKRVFEGLQLVTIGGILLANTTGVLPWSVWWTILMLWPLLLVSLGIDILGRALNSTALRVLATVVVIVGLLYGALSGSGRVQAPVFGSAGTPFSLSAPASTARTGTARVSAGLTRVTLKPRSGVLASAEGETPFGKPTLDVDTAGDTAHVRVATAERGIVVTGGTRSRIAVTLDPAVTWDAITLNGGMCDLDLDLSGFDMRRFETNVGMSNARITFGTQSSGTAVARISGGMSSFTLRVPAGLGVEVVADNGLGSVNVPGGWSRTGGDGPFQGRWRSDGYDTAASKLRIEVKTGLSSVDVQRY